VRDYAQAADDLGFSHLLAYDHVLGADPDRPGGWRGPYNVHTLFHEPLVLFAYMAGLTRRIEFVTGILILPQRQTALVAKQAAELDVLSGGRLRLGVAVGWNAVEYESLGESFETRGRRISEQIEVMRALWTQEVVDFKGRWHTIPKAGINPLPVQRPIPIWMGGESDIVQKRAARIADGWMPHLAPGPKGQAGVDRILTLVREAGRDPARFGIEGRMTLARLPREQWQKELEGWRAMRGITHLSINTMGLGLEKPDQHVELLREVRGMVVAAGLGR